MMTKTKNTKRALLMNGLALLMCISMLIGSTFAWFTDSVTSKGNIIKSGTLDVEMYWAKGTEAPASANWNDASNGAIFDCDLWEPSYTEVRHIKIENKGSLALKYQLSIAANGEVSELADVIDVYYLDPAQQLSERSAIASDKKLGTLTQVLAAISTTASGDLEPGQSHTITLALKMQESAGNTYQDKSIGADFSVILAATQKDFETDSFGKDYDEGLTPPDEDGDILVEENGIQYVYTDDGEYILYLVTEGYAEDTVIVPEGVTSIGNYAFAYNNNVKEVVLSSTVRSLGRGFDSSTVEKVVLNEGLQQIDSRAFRSTTNLKEVVISSTVKTIADNAFQKSAIKEIVIPATVETIGEAAFGASKIETVTFEGNTSIQGYAFRGCPELRTVYLKGDDVTFIPSTLNGRNSMWFCNGESNNPNTSDITFYVENETVEARVKAAMGAEASNTTIYVGGKLNVKVTSEDELLAALANATGEVVIDATGVTVNIDDIPDGKSATFLYIASGVTLKGATINPTYRGGNYVMFTAGAGDKVVFEDCVFSNTKNLVLGSTADGPDSVVYNNCDFEGYVITNFVDNLDGVAEFNNCEFKTNSSNRQNFVEGMGGTHNFNSCTFDFTGVTQTSMGVITNGCVNVYSEPEYSTTVVLNGCTRKNCGTRTYGPNSSLVIK